MPYPTINQYNEVLQHPETAFTDPILKSGSVKATGLGLPLALCGGFALTYIISDGQKKYAVRCFQKESTDLEQRYKAISEKIKSINSPYFVDFSYQTHGIRVNGSNYPIVKMDWAAGTTLGEFLEANNRNQTALAYLTDSLQSLSAYLESQKIAHGDIQPGNLMVSFSGRTIQLIDYDGMYVESIKNLGSSELGLRNFQHPFRRTSYWDPTLDRFSFIALNLALRALSFNPTLWTKSQSDSETIFFSASDYEKPESSAIFAELRKIPQLSTDANNFALICKSSVNQIPTLTEFIAGRNIPGTTFNFTSPVSFGETQYVSSLPILDAFNYPQCLKFTGQRIELIGKITEVRPGRTKYKRLPYFFLNFGNWLGEIVKLAIWSDGLENLQQIPDANWKNRWVSVIGLLDPPYYSEKFNYTHQSITITQSNQIRFISEDEARRRLSGRQGQPLTQTRQKTNDEIVERARNYAQLPKANVQAVGPKTSSTPNNKQIVENIRNLQQPAQTQTNYRPLSNPTQNTRPALSESSKTNQQQVSSYSQNPRPTFTSSTNSNQQNKSVSNDYCFIATSLYGKNAPKTILLRNYRDQHLLNNMLGRSFVSVYYKLSPFWVLIMKRYKFAQKQTLHSVDFIVKLIVGLNKS